MLKARLGTVSQLDPLTVEVAGEARRAWVDTGLLGTVEVGDEVVVNTEALDLGLGSGGYDVVIVNLRRGLDAEPAAGAAVKLNYTPLQHTIDTIEAAVEIEGGLRPARPIPVLVLMLHGQLAPAAWAAAQTKPDLRVGYIQTGGGALPGRLSDTVAELRSQEILCGHVTAGPAYGGEEEAITTIGAMHAAAEILAWDAAIVGPGPGIIGSATALGHGGMAALDSIHAALSLGMPVLLAPRASSADPRERHRGVSHHTRTVLELLLGEVAVAVPDGAHELAEEIGGITGSHAVDVRPVDPEAYSHSGLPVRTMGRSLSEDPIFFETALAAGAALVESGR